LLIKIISGIHNYTMAKLNFTKPVLILLYGYPGSGKTYFSRQLVDEVNIANLQADRIRTEMFENPTYTQQEDAVVQRIMNYLTEELLSAGVSVIYDTNALRLSQRKALKDIATRAKAVDVIVWFQIDVESAFTRVATRDRRQSDSKYAMALDRTTYESILQYMQNPSNREGYIVVSGKQYFKTQFATLSKKLRDIGAFEASDKDSPVIKPGLVNLIPSSSVRSTIDRRNIFIR
jgi:predicted kinase